MARVEPRLEGAEQLEAVGKALENFTPDQSFAPTDHRGIAELVAELEKAIESHDIMNRKSLTAINEQVKNIKTRLERFNRFQSVFYNGQT